MIARLPAPVSTKTAPTRARRQVKPRSVGFLIFKPDVFLNGGKEELRGRMDETLRKVRACEKADGVERIYTSGEIEAEVEQKRSKEGIPLTAGEVDALHALADKAGVSVRLEGLP